MIEVFINLFFHSDDSYLAHELSIDKYQDHSPLHFFNVNHPDFNKQQPLEAVHATEGRPGTNAPSTAEFHKIQVAQHLSSR